MNNYLLCGIVCVFGILSYLAFSSMQIVSGGPSPAVTNSMTLSDALVGIGVVVVTIVIVVLVMFFSAKKIFNLKWEK